MRVAVSFLTSDEAEMTAENILKKIPELEAAGADTIQWDLMDGIYNGNETFRWFSDDVIKKVMAGTTLGSEAHLMVKDPWNYIERVAPYSDLIMFQIEACDADEEIHDTIVRIKREGKRAGIALEPATPASVVEPWIDEIHNVLVMTVKTGFAGQAFIDQTEKIKELVDMRRHHGRDIEIEVDGGVNDKTIEKIRNAGTDAVNSASYILKNDFKKAISTLKGKS